MEQKNRLFEAVIAYGNGNPDAFNIIYEESNKYIYTCIYKVVNGNDNAQDIICDVLQDTYVQISKSIDQLDDANKFLSWAGMIATRKCYQYLKKSNKYVLLGEEDTTFENISDDDAIIPEEVMQSREKQRLLREIIDTQLTEMQKLCIIAYYYNEQKQSEIAEALGIPENTVKTNLSRAKAKIKEGVLDLEKNKGTRLYSVAPLLLLLFKEDVMAAALPGEVQYKGLVSVEAIVADAKAAAISSAVTNVANKTATEHVAMAKNASTAGESATATKVAVGKTVATLGKAATVSLKAKVIAAAIGIGAIGVTGASVAVISDYAQEYFLDEDEEEKEDKDEEKDVDDTEEITTEELTTENVAEEDTEEIVPENVVTIRDVLQNPEMYPEYIPADIDMEDIWFAVVDYNGNGYKEVIIGTAYNTAYYAPNKIVNILEIRNDVIVDMNGESVYEMYEDWTLYDTGVLCTLIYNSYGPTRIWNISTGEYWEGAASIPTEESAYAPAGERETHASLTDINGNTYELEAGDALYDTLHTGTPVDLEWYEAIDGNIDEFFN